METILIKQKGVNCYVIKSSKDWILVDAGGSIESLLEHIKSNGLYLENLKLIIITHVHSDHVSALKAIKEKANCKILVHKGDEEALKTGYKALGEGTLYISKILRFIAYNFAKKSLQFEAVVPDIVIEEQYELSEYGFDARIISTPGHTEGSISIILENHEVIVGDVLFNIIKNKSISFYTNNKHELLDSCEKLLQAKYDKYYVGHGEPLSYGEYASRFKKIKFKLLQN